jgi:hypothetical protein
MFSFSRALSPLCILHFGGVVFCLDFDFDFCSLVPLLGVFSLCLFIYAFISGSTDSLTMINQCVRN